MPLIQESQTSLSLLAHKAQLEQQAHKARQVQLVLPEQLELPEQPEQLEQLAQLAQLAQLETVSQRLSELLALALQVQPTLSRSLSQVDQQPLSPFTTEPTELMARQVQREQLEQRVLLEQMEPTEPMVAE
jgi:hypothetical protein